MHDGRVRVSIRDVAQRAGVSVGTVSNALNRPQVVGPSTLERVRAAVAELGYVRSDSARQLRSGIARTIGLVVVDVRNPFFTDVARGVEDVANAEGLSVILCNSDDREDKEDTYLNLLEEQRVRGVVIAPVNPGSSALRRLRETGTPVILMDVKVPRTRGCSVSVDDVAGGRLAMEHLLALGHREIALVTGPLRYRQCHDRLTGATTALRAAGLDSERLIVADAGGLDVPAGHKGAEQALASGACTAVFCTNDLLALGVRQFAREEGIAIPNELSIVGYDDIEFAAVMSLTTVRQPRHDLGVAGAELLIAETSEDDHEHSQTVFLPELVVRGSTAPPS
jgi:LacI family transcriptional regulator